MVKLSAKVSFDIKLERKFQRDKVESCSPIRSKGIHRWGPFCFSGLTTRDFSGALEGCLAPGSGLIP